MLEEICAHLHNFFTAWKGVHRGAFRIENGTVSLPFLAAGQYFRIVGSALNDGVYCYPPANLTDEVFFGEIWAMKVPKGLLRLAADIESWQEAQGERVLTPFRSERFAGYEYRLRDDAGGAAAWQTVFRRRLNRYRKLG